MKIFRFDREIGRTVDQYNSSGFVISRVVELLGEAVVHCAYLEAKGIIGFHPAADAQLFLVVQGEGWVSGESREKISIRTGQAAYWEKGEFHESGTDMGMTAIIVEGPDLDPAKRMPPV